MSLWSALAQGRVFVLAVAASSVSAFCLGCVVQSSSGGSSGYSYGGGAASSGGSSSSSGSGSDSTKPMLVVVDADRTMNASPGQGVGVFTEYKTGGHWHIWWTCDTSKTSQSCAFDVVATVSTGAISNVASAPAQGGAYAVQTQPQEAEAQIVTTSGVNGMTFDAPAGATITLDAQMDGQRDGAFLFFVQDGAINGGYTGNLTDPLMLEPSAP
jgi:hypothetical protein